MSRSERIDCALATRRRLFGLAVAANDFSAAARVLDGIEKLSGLGIGEPIAAVVVERVDLASLSDDARKRLRAIAVEALGPVAAPMTGKSDEAATNGHATRDWN